jgi:DNA-binding transcriptional LysR family regulator
MLDWYGLRVFLAVARHGSTVAAAKVLQINQSTVQRRLAELERCVGLPLVKPHPTGYRLTEFGEGLLPQASAVGAAVQELEHRIESLRRDVVGVISITGPEPLAYRITQSKLLDRFHARHPGLRVELVMSDKYLDIAKGDTDVALQGGDDDDKELVGRKIGDSIWRNQACEPCTQRMHNAHTTRAQRNHPRKPPPPSASPMVARRAAPSRLAADAWTSETGRGDSSGGQSCGERLPQPTMAAHSDGTATAPQRWPGTLQSGPW